MSLAKRITKFLASGLALLALGACRDEAEDDGRPLVVATTTIAADLVRAVAGERVELRTLMGPGMDPHGYVPRLSDTRLLERADLIVCHGLNLEGRLQATLETMAGRGRAVLVLGDQVPEEKLLAATDAEGGPKDPHVWGDPRLWSLTIGPMAEALTRIDPAGEAEFAERAAAHREELAALDEWIRREMEALEPENRVLVTGHDAFHYFARAYGFEVRSLQGVSTAVETSLRERQELVEFLRQRGVRAIFAESSINPKAIAAVANEAGVRVAEDELFSDALGEPGERFEIDGESHDRGTYPGMMRHNASAILRALRP